MLLCHTSGSAFVYFILHSDVNLSWIIIQFRIERGAQSLGISQLFHMSNFIFWRWRIYNLLQSRQIFFLIKNHFTLKIIYIYSSNSLETKVVISFLFCFICSWPIKTCKVQQTLEMNAPTFHHFRLLISSIGCAILVIYIKITFNFMN